MDETTGRICILIFKGAHYDLYSVRYLLDGGISDHYDFKAWRFYRFRFNCIVTPIYSSIPQSGKPTSVCVVGYR